MVTPKKPLYNFTNQEGWDLTAQVEFISLESHFTSQLYDFVPCIDQPNTWIPGCFAELIYIPITHHFK